MNEKFPRFPVLLVDDESETLRSMEYILELSGITNVRLCEDSRQVQRLISEFDFSTVSLDLNMPHITGQEILDIIMTERPELPVITVTAANDVETAVDCMKAGAIDYLVKPVDGPRLTASIRRAVEMWELRRENIRLNESFLSDELEQPDTFNRIKTSDRKMHRIFEYIEVIAPTSLPMLVTGETGTGKELIAASIHSASGRTGEFVAVNVAGLDDTMFSDVLFGHLAGAYTGATKNRNGMIKNAANGTLFLDEIGDLSKGSQVKLLRLLQENEYLPLGADRPLKTNARFVMATNRDLISASSDGEFRMDLYYRLKSHQVRIPALRERRGDVRILADYFLEMACTEVGKEVPRIPEELYITLESRDFPGNVRELQGMMYDLAVRNTSNVLSLGPIYSILDIPGTPSAMAADGENHYRSLANLPTAEKAIDLLVEETMRRCEGNQTRAAELLGMNRTTLNRRLNSKE